MTSLLTISIHDVCRGLAPRTVTLVAAALASGGSPAALAAKSSRETVSSAARAPPARLQGVGHLATSIAFAVVAALFLTQRHQCAERGKNEKHLPKQTGNLELTIFVFNYQACGLELA